MDVGTVVADPDLEFERSEGIDNGSLIVGLDEVGRGSWAGCVMIGACVIDPSRVIEGVRDSKLLTPARRRELFQQVADSAIAWSVGSCDNKEIDKWGMTKALRVAAQRSIQSLSVTPDHILLDGHHDYVASTIPTTTIIKGDMKSYSIAAASILAKVTRDQMMIDAGEQFPGFDFESNKGYPAPRHQMALRAYGPTRLHRLSWAWVDNLAWSSVWSKAKTDVDLTLFD